MKNYSAGGNAGVDLRGQTPRFTEGRTVQAAGCSGARLAATRSMKETLAEVGSTPIPGSNRNVLFSNQLLPHTWN